MPDDTAKGSTRKVVQRGYHSSSSSCASDDDESSTNIPIKSRGLTREAQLQKDLNFNDRYETVKFTETPFTLARTAARRRERSSNSPNGAGGSQGARVGLATNRKIGANGGWQITTKATKGESMKSGPTANDVKKKIGGNIKVASADPDAPPEEAKPQESHKKRWHANPNKKDDTEEPPKKKNNLGGWQVQGSAAVTLVKKKSEPKAKGKGGRKPKAGKEQEEAPGDAQPGPSKAADQKKGKPRGKKESDENDDKITFSRIPVGARPSSSFPILQGFQKQRELSTSKWKVTPIESFPLKMAAEREESDNSDFDLNRLFEGIAKGAETDLKKQQARQPTGALSTETAWTVTGPADLQIGGRSQERGDVDNDTRLGRPGAQQIIGQTLSPDHSSVADPVAGPAADDEGDDSVDVDLASSDEEPLDPVVRQQRSQLQEIRIALQCENARYRQAKEAEAEERARQRVTDTGPAWSGQEQDTDLMTYSGTTKVPSTFTNPKYGSRTPVKPHNDGREPSTITHVSIPSAKITSHYFDPSSSSCDLPYSSPLSNRSGQGQQAQIYQPRPQPVRGSGSARVKVLESWVDRQQGIDLGPPYTEHAGGRMAARQVRPLSHARLYDGQGHVQPYYRDPERGIYHYPPADILPDAAHLPRDQYEVTPPELCGPFGHDFPKRDVEFDRDERPHRPQPRPPSERGLSPDLPPAYINKRRRRHVPRLTNPSSNGASPTSSWSTLKPLIKQDHQARPVPLTYRTSGNFTLPLSKVSGNVGSSASKAPSAHRARASWFKPPSPPLEALQTHEAARSDYQPGKGMLLAREGGVDEHDCLRDRVRTAVGIPRRSARMVIGSAHLQPEAVEAEQDRGALGEEDWRSAWTKKGAKTTCHPTVALSRFAYGAASG